MPMLQSKILTFISSVLLALFAIAILGPTDVMGTVSSKTPTASTVKKGGSKTKRVAAKKRRIRRTKRTACNTSKGKQQAIDLVRTQSMELCKLTGLEYVNSAEALAEAKVRLQQDGETLTDDEADQVLEMQELEAEDDVTVDLEQFKTLWLSYVDAGAEDVTEAGVTKQRIVDVIMEWLGTRYHYGGTTSGGIDCSAFVRQVYANTAGIELPRTAAEQSTIGVTIRDRTKLQFGDLVFFNTRRRVRVSHVGIYLGDNLFAHSSSRFGVTISSLESTYYNKRFLAGKRIDQKAIAQLSPTAGL